MSIISQTSITIIDIVYQIENPVAPPNSPCGQVHVNDLGDVSMTFTFPAEVTTWSHVSATVEFTPHGGNVSVNPARHSF